jgi:hypothetical protein
MAIKGSCLCGEIHYSVEAPLGDAIVCHCQKCRKANGSAYAVNVPIVAEDFTLIQGEAFLKSYLSSSDARRYFCSQCGSPIYSQRLSLPDIFRLRVGTLDDDIDLTKSAHVFVGSKAKWDDISDNLPQYVERPE